MATIEQTHQWLQATLNPDLAQRQAAEEALKQAEPTPQHAVQLFRLAADSSVQVDDAMRQAAAIRMKSVISRRWDPSEGTQGLSDADKAVVRDNLVEAMVFAESRVRTQLGLSLRAIAQVDYPDRWPGLVPAIVTNLQQQDPQRLYGALFALRTLVKVYEFRQDPNRGPLHHIVEQTWPHMGNLVAALLASEPSVQASDLLLLAMKIVWSATQISLPPLLMAPEQLASWMHLLLSTLEQPLPPDAPADLDAAASWKPWKVKKRVAQILHRLLQRYGNPQRKPREGPSAEALTAFAQTFHDEYSSRCLEKCMAVLAHRINGVACPDRVVTLCLNYVEECIKFKKTYAVLKAHMEGLLFRVLFPLLCFSERDQKQWDEDPVEYVRKEFDVIEDFYNPRTAASAVLYTLVSSRGKETLPMVVGFCQQKLQEAHGSHEPARLMAKDGALLSLGALQDKLHKKDAYKSLLEPMLYQFVLPELESPYGFMRSRAVWAFSQFAKSTFASGAARSPEQFGAVFGRIMASMKDAELPVRVQAALAINNIVEYNCAEAAVLSVLPQLVEALFALMNDIGNEEVVQTLDNLIERYGDRMAPYAVQIVGALANNFLRLFEECDDDGDDESLAAMWVMQAISTMMEAVKDRPECYAQMEQHLLPMLSRMMGESARDFFEDVNEVLAYLTYYSPQISDGLWALFPLMHEAFHVWAFEYVNNLLVPIDNFISRATDRFVTGGAMVGDTYTPYLQMVLSICRATLTTHASSLPDHEQHGACKLMESLLHNCRGRIDAVVPDLLGLALSRLDGLLQAEEGERKEAMITLLYNVLSSALHYSPSLALQVLQHRSGAAWMGVLQAWMAHLQCSKKLRLHDLKCGVLAVASLLSLPPAEAPAVIAQNPLLLVQSGMKLLQAMEKKRAEESEREARAKADDDGDDDDGDDDDDLDDDQDATDEGGLSGSALRIYGGLGNAGGIMASDFFGDDFDDDDDLDDEEMYSTPLDSIDELIGFTDAVQAACGASPALLALAGLAPAVDGAAPQLSPEDSAVLNTILAAGVAKKAQAAQQALAGEHGPPGDA